MTYTVFQLDGMDCAALSGMMPDQLENEIPSHWNNYVTVDDIDALVDVVNKNGGGLLFGPEDVFDNGRMMGIQDPGGAALNLWQPYNSIGAGIVNIPGAMVWNELQTWDAGDSKSILCRRFRLGILRTREWLHLHHESRPAQRRLPDSGRKLR